MPLIVRVPPGVPGLKAGTNAGTISSKPVNLLSLFPTLTELCGLPRHPDSDGPSLVPLLGNPEADWDHVSVTHLGEAGSYGLSTVGWRLIHYANGDEELYDVANDPFEWTNLAEDPEHAAQRDRLRAAAPKTFAKKVPPSEDSLTKLKWHPVTDEPVPASKPDGNPFRVVFINKRDTPVELYWMDRSGKPKSYGGIEAGKRKRQQTRPGAVWQIADEAETPLGYFVVDDRTAQAIVPPVDP